MFVGRSCDKRDGGVGAAQRGFVRAGRASGRAFARGRHAVAGGCAVGDPPGAMRAARGCLGIAAVPRVLYILYWDIRWRDGSADGSCLASRGLGIHVPTAALRFLAAFVPLIAALQFAVCTERSPRC